MTADDRFLLFVSYSCQDRQHPFLAELRQFSEDPDVAKVAALYTAEDSPDHGRDFVAKVLDELESAGAVLPFITPASQAAPWVNQEIGYALARGIPVYPAFDSREVTRLQGMIQTTDACLVNDPAQVRALFRRVIDLAKQEPVTRRRGLSIAVEGVRWCMLHNCTIPMYVRLKLRHLSREPDSVERVYLECPNRTVELDRVDRDKLRELKTAHAEDVVLKFFPNGPGQQAERMKLVIQTVRGRKAEAEFQAAPSGWWPDEVWKNFVPY